MHAYRRERHDSPATFRPPINAAVPTEAYLVAWKCDQVEPLSPVCFIQLPQPRIVHILHSTMMLHCARNWLPAALAAGCTASSNNVDSANRGRAPNSTRTGTRGCHACWYTSPQFIGFRTVEGVGARPTVHTCRGHSEATFTMTNTSPLVPRHCNVSPILLYCESKCTHCLGRSNCSMHLADKASWGGCQEQLSAPERAANSCIPSGGALRSHAACRRQARGASCCGRAH